MVKTPERRAPAASAHTHAEGEDPIRWRILAVLIVTMFMTLINVSIVNVALPSIGRGLGATPADLQWVLSGYALTFGVILIAAGRAGDIMGRGGIFVTGVAIFTLSSVAAGMAPNAESLNLARVTQGIGSGLLNPQGLGMIQQYFRGAERGRAFGQLGIAVGLSVAIGPVLGGLLIELGGPNLGWRLTFLVNVPIGIAAIVLALKWFPRPLIRRFPSLPVALRDLDAIGALLLGSALLALLIPFVEARNTPVLWLLLPCAAALTALWLWWERRYQRLGLNPMFDLQIFKHSSFRNGILVIAFFFMGMPSLWVLVALYVQEGGGGTALDAGLIGVPSSLIGAYAAHWAGSRVARYGRKMVIGGMLVTLVGVVLCVLVILLHEAGQVSLWWLAGAMCFVGVAQGLVISPNQALTLEQVPLDYAGSSGGIMQTGQRIGTAVGFAVITAATYATLAVSSWALAVTAGLGLIALMVLLGMAVAYKDLRAREA
ncbi:MFS transporter [Pararhodobacter oceanensis]|uniref:MFS transporter n=1 Tax=Pararhodobacter oceanensis TaxID=2172121 RepID=UPI003A8FA2F2